jgi:hypothetical protein
MAAEEEVVTSKQHKQVVALGKERRLRRWQSDNKGSSGDGVLLNFYVFGLLTKSKFECSKDGVTICIHKKYNKDLNLKNHLIKLKIHHIGIINMVIIIIGSSYDI